MSPPPTSIDGTDITGATIDGQEVEEITVDGDVVFKGIPDSGADHQWNYVEGSGTTVADNIGSLDADWSDGITWVGGPGAKGVHASLDGNDDYGDLGTASRSEFRHFVDAQQGTLFSWLRIDSFDKQRLEIIGSGAGGIPGFDLYFENAGAGSGYSFRLGDNTTDGGPLRAGSLPPTGEWIVTAATISGNTTRVFEALPSTDYSVIEVASAGSPSSVNSDLDFKVSIGRRTSNNGRHFNGDFDIQFVDSVARTQSQLQSFVDDTKQFYE
jgi:hypothetical protein